MDNIHYDGYTLDFSHIQKDNKKYCGKASSFEKDINNFGKYIVGYFREYNTYPGTHIPCGIDEVKVYKNRVNITCWSMLGKQGYRVYYFVYKSNIIFAHCYVKAKCNIHNETEHFKNIFQERFL